jgi:hypothetical protein
LLAETSLGFNTSTADISQHLTAITLNNFLTAVAIAQYGELHGEPFSILSRFEAGNHPAAATSAASYTVEPE